MRDGPQAGDSTAARSDSCSCDEPRCGLLESMRRFRRTQIPDATGFLEKTARCASTKSHAAECQVVREGVTRREAVFESGAACATHEWKPKTPGSRLAERDGLQSMSIWFQRALPHQQADLVAEENRYPQT